MSAETFRPIIEAVRADGFVPRLVGAGLELHGEVSVGRQAVPLTIVFADLSLAQSPRVLIPDVSMLGRKVVPHVDDARELCVVDRRMHVFDRYRAPEQTRGLIVRAAEVLQRGMTKGGTAEIAEEFGAYWSSTYFELPDADAASTVLNLAHVTTAARLSFAAHQDKPEALGDLLDWASHWDPTLSARLITAISRLTAADPIVAIHAPNGVAVAQILMFARGSRFVESLKRPKAWAHFIASAPARTLKIKREQGRRIDIAKVLGANGTDGQAPLAGRRIVLIGCGAIGGYLARMLGQLGAGIAGTLTLVDSDRLDRTNVRRHQLGLGDLGRHKAMACAEALGRDLPGLQIIPLCAEAQRHEVVLAQADLIIDATGEQEFSEWLNSWALTRRSAGEDCPAILFTWVAGHGAAVQSFLSLNTDFACYRCLQPDLTKPARFDPLREPTPQPVGACGEQPITPYGPTAPVAAASLAAGHASDWATGKPHHLLRTTRIDWKATVKRDPRSPDKANDCPACGGS